ncbi:MAG: DNA polymerase Y family protein [Hyphomicrobiales bacterium]|nr:DNA polymerase Y family protein [Hyphomicrobiales bacterium]
MSSAFTSGSQRIVSLWFPHLPTDRIMRQRFGRCWRSDPAVTAKRADRPPLAISHDDRNARRIAALCERASALGLRRGMGLTDARAMHPALEFVEAEPEVDRRLLTGLADWCDRYTPLVALDGDDGLFLDITGCAHLFGGEKALLADLLARLFHQGFDARVGLASTPGMAWAAARYLAQTCSEGKIVDKGREAETLGPFPLNALRLEAETVTQIESVGLRTIGAVLSAARAPLARRYGRQMLTRLDQAIGRIDEPVSPRMAVAELSVERRLAEPVSLAEDVERITGLLCTTLKTHLEQRGEGARALELALFRIDGAVHRLAVGLSRPARDPPLMTRLFAERLTALTNDFDAGYGYEIVRLSVLAAAPFDSRQADLAGDDLSQGEDLARLVDRIHARLGKTAILQPELRESHIPERTVSMTAFAGIAKPAKSGKTGLKGEKDQETAAPPRPIRLFERPEPIEAMAEVPEGPPITFRWRRALHRVVAAEGPERIEAEWWRDDEARPRDYYRIEDEVGRRYWLYRQGLFTAHDAPPPRWFMHGIFA